MTALIVAAKRPEPGRVKTRLCPPLSLHEAAAVAAAALTDTLRVIDATPAERRVLCFDGALAGWERPGWTHRAQCAGGLDRRLADAFGAADGAALLVGMDTPQLDPALLSAFDPTRFDACLGPTADGGYWAIGLTDPRLGGAAIVGVPMSTDRTYEAQLIRLESLGLRVQILPVLIDVDTFTDALTVAANASHTRFAAAVTAIVAEYV